MIGNILKLGGYALLAKEAADFLIDSKNYRERERERREMTCSISGSLLGIVVGVGVGILFAPRAGKETREMICDAACTQMDRLQSGLAEGTRQFGEKISKTAQEMETKGEQAAGETE